MQYRLEQLLPLYNALYCASVTGSVSEIYLNKIWINEKCVVKKTPFKHLLLVKLQLNFSYARLRRTPVRNLLVDGSAVAVDFGVSD